MAAVIHHGGAGTTATTAISGVPQIIVPTSWTNITGAIRYINPILVPNPSGDPN